MTYSDFGLDMVEYKLGLILQRARLFAGISPVAMPTWLQEVLESSKQLAFVSEKARSEFIVAPILLSVRLLSGERITIYSGQRLDVDAERGHGRKAVYGCVTTGEAWQFLKLSQAIATIDSERYYIDYAVMGFSSYFDRCGYRS
jgi:hypothetical protein